MLVTPKAGRLHTAKVDFHDHLYYPVSQSDGTLSVMARLELIEEEEGEEEEAAAAATAAVVMAHEESMVPYSSDEHRVVRSPA